MVLGGLLASSAGPAAGQALTTQPFSAYGQGDAIALAGLNSGTSTVAGLRVAASGGSVNSGAAGLTTPITGHTLPIAPGKHKVTFVYSGGKAQQVVTVKPGETVTLNKDLR